MRPVLAKYQGGLGVIDVTPTESNQIAELFKILDHPDGVRCPGNRPTEKARFEELIASLFPEFPLPKSDRYHAFTNYSGYTIPTGEREAVIRSGLVLTGKVRPVLAGKERPDAELRIITSGSARNKFYVTVALHSLYERDCVDDLVDKLALGIGIFSPQPIPSEVKEYGLPEVSHLCSAQRHYELAAGIIEKTEQSRLNLRTMLNILRRDGTEHENVVIRELSSDRYNRELNSLKEVIQRRV